MGFWDPKISIEIRKFRIFIFCQKLLFVSVKLVQRLWDFGIGIRKFSIEIRNSRIFQKYFFCQKMSFVSVKPVQRAWNFGSESENLDRNPKPSKILAADMTQKCMLLGQFSLNATARFPDLELRATRLFVYLFVIHYINFNLARLLPPSNKPLVAVISKII